MVINYKGDVHMIYNHSSIKRDIISVITKTYKDKSIDDLTNSELIEALSKALPDIINKIITNELKR